MTHVREFFGPNKLPGVAAPLKTFIVILAVRETEREVGDCS